MQEEDLLSSSDIQYPANTIKGKVNFAKIEKWKHPILQKAFANFSEKHFLKYETEYWQFIDEHSWWLNDHALFMAAHTHFGNKHWQEWDTEIKFRTPEALNALRNELEQEINFQQFVQFLFFRQWHQLTNYANEKGIEIIGDVPLYVSGDSSDVWANTDIFLLDENLKPTLVGGVPPDYFSETGQLWGNPVFNWQRLQEREYDWWMARLHFNLRMFNQIRIDHFRGLESFWAVPANEKTAINGSWYPAHGYEMLGLIKSQIGHLPFIAEDLGTITPEVNQLRKTFQLPGMKVLQFAFTTDTTNTDLPHNYEKNTVVYSGTHDNNTTLGWLNLASENEKKIIQQYITSQDKSALDEVMEMAMGSVAETAIFPMQDVLQLDEKSSMNTPGTANGNWDWRFQWKQLKEHQKERLTTLTLKYNRG